MSPSGYGTCFGYKISWVRVPPFRPGSTGIQTLSSVARTLLSHGRYRGFESHSVYEEKVSTAFLGFVASFTGYRIKRLERVISYLTPTEVETVEHT